MSDNKRKNDIEDKPYYEENYDVNDDLDSLRRSLSNQVNDELDQQDSYQPPKRGITKKKKSKKILLRVVFITLSVLIILSAGILGTKSGRHVLYKIASNYIYNSMNTVKDDGKDSTSVEASTGDNAPVKETKYRHEAYVKNYLLFGIEQFGGAKNTDSMMIASLNTKDNTVKLTSILRDTLIERPGMKPRKLNSFFATDGTDGLINIIEEKYLIQIDGYAYIDFDSFEKIIDRLGGIDVELGDKEAAYLNRTNYISNKAYRNVKPGWNHLNGNQALGYSRVRKTATLGGARFDYGRSLRQRRVLQACFDKYKSQSVFKLLPIARDCLGYLTTNLSKSQIEGLIESVVENKIRTLDTFRIPVDGIFEAPEEYHGVDYPLVLDWDKNIIELYKFVFLDTDQQAAAALAQQRAQ